MTRIIKNHKNENFLVIGKENFTVVFYKQLRKKNYNKACKIAKKLWLGEKL